MQRYEICPSCGCRCVGASITTHHCDPEDVQRAERARLAPRITLTLAQDTIDVAVEDYAIWVRRELAQRYPHAALRVRTTRRASGAMPPVIEAATWQEEDAIRQTVERLWETYCTREPHPDWDADSDSTAGLEGTGEIER